MEMIDKKAIIKGCLIKQEMQIQDFEKEIQDLKSEIYDHDVIPSQDGGGTTERQEVLARYESELEFLKSELAKLESIDWERVHEVVDTGAVVVTDKRVFFVAVSTEEVEVNGSSIFGLSTQAPIFLQMKGKKSGDEFDFNGQHYKISKVY
ncbi:hypothetical protein [Algoriphagus zhangzhouensis]|uniref:Transcription elongation factor, GreA/GreB, C-term n=1 Tax=Algoriphagus zhangzhouensis TaxID=1073327 RepID=A0A1M7ZF32_9BACT|nr:hypothetical protein [Algoriphagus zhangzhouensis]TDY46185.1 hypothetical protein A8938_2796 [Algoriphagus zhangzhouensis]SHO63497.1 hypothetical protein SAMN04488108_2793 [Algoriphagus zhangzhouensis]